VQGNPVLVRQPALVHGVRHHHALHDLGAGEDELERVLGVGPAKLLVMVAPVHVHHPPPPDVGGEAAAHLDALVEVGEEDVEAGVVGRVYVPRHGPRGAAEVEEVAGQGRPYLPDDPVFVVQGGQQDDQGGHSPHPP
jgi:hypothetical protein